MKTRTLAAFAAAAIAVAGCTVGPDYVRPGVDSPTAWRIDYPKAAEVANTKWWEQFGDPVAERADRDRAARESRHSHRRRPDGAVPRRADEHAVAVAAANRLQRRCQPRAARPASASLRFPDGVDRSSRCTRASLGASWQLDLFGRVRRLSEAAQAQVYASEQAAARRRADRSGRGRDQLHHAARARPATGDRAGDRGKFRRDRAHLQLALQVRPRVAIRSGADRIAISAGARRDPGDRAADRGRRKT